jgi:hypothetical protein
MGVTPSAERSLLTAIEPLHAIAYFAPSAAAALKDLGLKGYWMGYFAGRFAPLGPVPPGPVTAMAYSFPSATVARALPDAWTYTTPEVALAARISGAAAALREALPPERYADLAALAPLLWDAVDACRFDGRPLAAGWAAVGRPADPADPGESVWLAATVLREHRGDGHIAACVTAGLSGLDAIVTHAAADQISRDLFAARRWSDDDWTTAEASLRDRGLLDVAGKLTDAGAALRQQVEDQTDRLATAPVERLGTAGLRQVTDLAAPLARALIDAKVVPVPSPAGAARP